MDTLLLEKNKDVVKLNVLHLDIMAMRNLFSEISRNKISSYLLFINSGI